MDTQRHNSPIFDSWMHKVITVVWEKFGVKKFSLDARYNKN